MVSLTRRYAFSASHRLHSEALSEAENVALYGKCNNPYGHGHDYVLGVTVRGPIDRETGLVIPISRLDELVEKEVLRRFRFTNVNLDLPQFAGLVPTTENMVTVITEILRENWNSYLGTSGARLRAVHIQETSRNGFTGLMPSRQKSNAAAPGTEMIHA